MGWFEETYAACRPVSLAPGDLLILGTDGIVETRRDGELFGMQRLGKLFIDGSRLPLPEILDNAVSATIAYNESSSLDDDVTILVLRRRHDHE